VRITKEHNAHHADKQEDLFISILHISQHCYFTVLFIFIGGTADITVHEKLSNGHLKELCYAVGSSCFNKLINGAPSILIIIWMKALSMDVPPQSPPLA
jgi:hypothetical protein